MKIKNLLFLFFLFLFFSLPSFANPKQGKITADLSVIQNRFDHVIIKMRGHLQLSDEATTIDTVKSNGGKFEYRFSVPETRMVSFTLLKNNMEVTVIGIKDTKTSEACAFFSEICVGNEDVKITYRFSEWRGQPIVVANGDGLKENKWHYWFETSGIDFDRVTKDFIIKHPDSFAILQAIYFQRIFFSNKEISEMLDLFSDELKHSATYGMLKNYVAQMSALEKGEYAKNFNWQDINGASFDFNLALNSKKYVLLVFWSSSCESCKYDIQALKRFQEKYADQVSIVKLSIDNDFETWKKAVEEEKMPCYNLSGLPNSKETIKEVYNIYTLPNFILLDSEGKPSIKEEITDLYTIESFFEYSKTLSK